MTGKERKGCEIEGREGKDGVLSYSARCVLCGAFVHVCLRQPSVNPILCIIFGRAFDLGSVINIFQFQASIESNSRLCFYNPSILPHVHNLKPTTSTLVYLANPGIPPHGRRIARFNTDNRRRSTCIKKVTVTSKPSIVLHSTASSTMPRSAPSTLRQNALRSALSLVSQHSFTRTALLTSIRQLPHHDSESLLQSPEVLVESLFGTGIEPEKSLVREWEARGLEGMKAAFPRDGEERAVAVTTGKGKGKATQVDFEALKRAMGARIRWSSETAGEHLVQVCPANMRETEF